MPGTVFDSKLRVWTYLGYIGVCILASWNRVLLCPLDEHGNRYKEVQAKILQLIMDLIWRFKPRLVVVVTPHPLPPTSKALAWKHHVLLHPRHSKGGGIAFQRPEWALTACPASGWHRQFSEKKKKGLKNTWVSLRKEPYLFIFLWFLFFPS